MKQTKIVCSVSDMRCDEDFLRKLFIAGMNVVRMNTAHATPEGIKKIIRNTRAVSPHIGILIDTKGPEVRTTATKEPIKYKAGDMVKIFGRPEMETSKDIVNVSYPDITKDVKKGDDLLFDDGAIDMKVVENTGPMLVAEVENDGVLGSHKSVNVPGEHIDLPALTDKDKRNIKLAIDEDIDFIAHSFVRSAADVNAVQEILDKYHSDIKIISKIENQEGVDNIDEIIDASYGIMVARGDLGIEVPIERIPGIQRMIINKCIKKKKPVIVATQMLHTMIENPRPTRAEVTDIANAIYSHTDALMLSGETASGKYPVEAVETMARVAEQAEADVHSNITEQQSRPTGILHPRGHRSDRGNWRQGNHHGLSDRTDSTQPCSFPWSQPGIGNLLQGEAATMAQLVVRYHSRVPEGARLNRISLLCRRQNAASERLHQQ